MNRFAIASALLCLLASPAKAADRNPTAVQAGSYIVESSHTRVQFSVSHFGFTDWFGDFTGATGTLTLDPADPTNGKLDVAIPVASVSTTNAKLDAELKSPAWFDATQFPTLRFVSTKVVRTTPDKADVTGDLTFHGVTRPVVLAVSFNGAGSDPTGKGYIVGFNATTLIRRSDFGVKTYLPMLGDEVSIRISAAFQKSN